MSVPFDTLPATSARRDWVWLLPLLLSLALVAGVLIWVRANEAQEQEQQRLTLISDALSAEAQLRERIADEAQRLREFAQHLDQHPEALERSAEAQAGLRRLWQSITRLDARQRVVDQTPASVPDSREDGLSLHLTAPLADGGLLVVRYAPALLLKRGVPWWLARRYDIQLLDSSDLVIATTTESAVRVAAGGERPSYRVTLTGPLRASPLAETTLSDANVELTLREPLQSDSRTLAWVLVAGFLPLLGLSTWLLRRRMHAVREAEARWRTEAAWRSAMQDSALVALRARDFEGRLLFVNRTFCEMVGHSAESLVGLKPPMPYWPPEALDEFTARNRRNLAGQAPREGYETRWMHASGRQVDVMVFESPLIDASGQQIGWMGSILDITERKRLEERERRQVETLAHNVRLTMLGEVASTLAHELNQPLTAVSSYAAGITNSLTRLGVNEPRVLEALQRLGQHAAQAGRVVQRIREFLTRREPEREACDLNAVIHAAVALMARELQRREVQLDLQLAAELPSVQADAVLIEQIVINLMRNAADALQALPEGRRIRVCSQVVADAVRIEVGDNGPGLQGRVLEQLCAPFYSTKAEGMGMGLAICRSILEAHEGRFEAGQSDLGGARFAFEIPR